MRHLAAICLLAALVCQLGDAQPFGMASAEIDGAASAEVDGAASGEAAETWVAAERELVLPTLYLRQMARCEGEQIGNEETSIRRCKRTCDADPECVGVNEDTNLRTCFAVKTGCQVVYDDDDYYTVYHVKQIGLPMPEPAVVTSFGGSQDGAASAEVGGAASAEVDGAASAEVGGVAETWVAIEQEMFQPAQRLTSASEVTETSYHQAQGGPDVVDGQSVSTEIIFFAIELDMSCDGGQQIGDEQIYMELCLETCKNDENCAGVNQDPVAGTCVAVGRDCSAAYVYSVVFHRKIATWIIVDPPFVPPPPGLIEPPFIPPPPGLIEPPPLPPSEVLFVSEQGQRCAGGGRVGDTAYDVAECKKACEDDDDCEGVNEVSDTGFCVARSKGCNLVDDPKAVFHRRVVITVSVDPIPPPPIAIIDQPPVVSVDPYPAGGMGSAEAVEDPDVIVTGQSVEIRSVDFVTEQGQRCGGGRRVGDTAYDVAECKKACEDDEDCEGVNEITESGFCVARSKGCNLVDDARAVFHRRVVNIVIADPRPYPYPIPPPVEVTDKPPVVIVEPPPHPYPYPIPPPIEVTDQPPVVIVEPPPRPYPIPPPPPEVDSVEIVEPEPPFEISEITFKPEQGKRCAGGDRVGDTSYDVADCKKACEEDDNCEGVNEITSSGFCVARSKGCNLVDDARAVFNRRVVMIAIVDPLPPRPPQPPTPTPPVVIVEPPPVEPRPYPIPPPPEVDSVEIVEPEMPYEITEVVFVQEQGKRCGGGRRVGDTSYDVADCKKACEEDDDCEGVNEITSSGFCVARSKGCNLVDDSRAVFNRRMVRISIVDPLPPTRPPPPTPTEPVVIVDTTPLEPLPSPPDESPILDFGELGVVDASVEEPVAQPAVTSGPVMVEVEVVTVRYEIEEGFRCGGGRKIGQLYQDFALCKAACDADDECAGINEVGGNCVSRGKGCNKVSDDRAKFHAKYIEVTIELVPGSEPETEAPTQPPVTEPPATQAPATQPPVTERVTEGQVMVEVEVETIRYVTEAGFRCGGGRKVGELYDDIALCKQACDADAECQGFNEVGGKCVARATGCNKVPDGNANFHTKTVEVTIELVPGTAPETEAPTQPPQTQPPTTQRPTTQAPTQPPTTQRPTTQAPTQPPTTQRPTTQAPTQPPTTQGAVEVEVVTIRYEIETGFRCGGGRKVGELYDDIALCKQACDADDECAGFNEVGDKCVARAKGCNKVPDGNAKFHTKYVEVTIEVVPGTAPATDAPTQPPQTDPPTTQPPTQMSTEAPKWKPEPRPCDVAHGYNWMDGDAFFRQGE